MIREYLKYLKVNGNFSWHDISQASGLPEATIRKIFSGETSDPRFETVVRLVAAMGGSLDKINAIEKVDSVEIGEDAQIKALVALKELYEERIKDIKSTSADHIQSLKKDKKLMIIIICILSILLMGVLVFDLFVGSVGWFRY